MTEPEEPLFFHVGIPLIIVGIIIILGAWGAIKGEPKPECWQGMEIGSDRRC